MTPLACTSPDFLVGFERVRSLELELLVETAPQSHAELHEGNAARVMLTSLAEAWKNLASGAGFYGRKLPSSEGWLLHNNPVHQARFAPLLPRFWMHDKAVSAREYQAARADLGRQGWQLDNRCYASGRKVTLASDSVLHYLSMSATGGDTRAMQDFELSFAGIDTPAGTARRWRINARFREEGWTALVREAWKLEVHLGGYLCPHCLASVDTDSFLEVHEGWEGLPRRQLKASPDQAELSRHVLVERYRCVHCGTHWEQDLSRLERKPA